ncbi:MAG TPA: ABC transporter permease, partial [Acidobacteriota bacterium]|nr:ABC transporter permease [Acidobacteriota bacterium]
MESFLQDLRYALRVLRKNRALTFVALISIALGLGANTAVFSAVNAVLLRTLPYASVNRLVLVWAKAQSHGALSDRDQVSATDVADFRAQNTVFEDVATFTGWVPILSGYGEAERIPAIQVGDGFFRVLNGKPMLGRTFVPEEQQDGKDFVIVLGYGLWQRKFGSDPKIVGKTVSLNSRPYTIVGVMPPGFRSLPPSLVSPEGQFYRPVAEAYNNTERDSRHLRAIARLKPVVTLQNAQSEMSLIAGRMEKQYPQT